MSRLVQRLWIILGFLVSICNAVSPNPDIPQFEFNILRIKTPQLIGIVCGCLVFTITISVVIYLLYASGTIKGFLEELRSSPISVESKALPQIEEMPRLHDYLLDARKTLPLCPVIPTTSGKNTSIHSLNSVSEDIIALLFEASNGSPQYHESAYNPLRLWGWIEGTSKYEGYIWDTLDNFKSYIGFRSSGQSAAIAITDLEFKKPIGLLILSDNSPDNLTIRIESIWITPAFQGKKRSHEAMLLVLQKLFEQSYRRVTFECDSRNTISRKFSERCGFVLESVIRKHKIVNERNRDTAVYVILNSEWDEKEFKLKKYLGWETKVKGVSAFAIPNPADEFKTRSSSNAKP